MKPNAMTSADGVLWSVTVETSLSHVLTPTKAKRRRKVVRTPDFVSLSEKNAISPILYTQLVELLRTNRDWLAEKGPCR
jgi:hypothetical protein